MCTAPAGKLAHSRPPAQRRCAAAAATLPLRCLQLEAAAAHTECPPACTPWSSGPILLDSLVCQPGANQTRLDDCDYNDVSNLPGFCSEHSQVRVQLEGEEECRRRL